MHSQTSQSFFCAFKSTNFSNFRGFQTLPLHVHAAFCYLLCEHCVYFFTQRILTDPQSHIIPRFWLPLTPFQVMQRAFGPRKHVRREPLRLPRREPRRRFRRGASPRQFLYPLFSCPPLCPLGSDIGCNGGMPSRKTTRRTVSGWQQRRFALSLLIPLDTGVRFRLQ